MAREKTGVIVSGAFGRMGRAVVRAVSAEKDMYVAGAVDVAGVGNDAGSVAGIAATGAIITDDIKKALKKTQAKVVVDFTIADHFFPRAKAVLDAGLSLVVGTTGIPAADLNKLEKLAAVKKLGVIVAPNFAIGAVLMIKFAAMAAPYMPAVEIIELHHDKKRDAPSGTALYTAQMVARAKKEIMKRKDPTTTVNLAGARGGAVGDIAVHSVRLPGFLAHQEVLFGAPGQSLTIRHDTTDRDAFMPGVVLAVRKVLKLDHAVFGLENVI